MDAPNAAGVIRPSSRQSMSQARVPADGNGIETQAVGMVVELFGGPLVEDTAQGSHVGLHVKPLLNQEPVG
jgi:hypothetical protein